MSSLADRLAGARLRRSHPANDNHVAELQSGRIAALRARFADWRRRSRSRAELAHFAERDLHDIGISPAQADRECAKPFWRA